MKQKYLCSLFYYYLFAITFKNLFSAGTKVSRKSNLNEIIFRVKRLNNQARSQKPCEILPSLGIRHGPSVVSFHILIFSSETTEPNWFQVVPAPSRFGPGHSGPSRSGPKLKVDSVPFEIKYF